jgi:hypothetical protein
VIYLAGLGIDDQKLVQNLASEPDDDVGLMH